MIIFDIETGPLPSEQLRQLCEPFTPPQHPGEFDPATVKTGNLKDEAKISAKIDDARAKHAQAVAEYEANAKQAETDYWADIEGKAALSPITGRVLAIGYLSTDTDKTILDIDDEQQMLVHFWQQYIRCVHEDRKLVGHNSMRFDVRFILRRSWILGVDVPPGVIDRGKWLDAKTFVDTMELWGEPVKLDLLGRVFGVGQKPDGVDGSMFADLLKTDRQVAEAYLKNDLIMTRDIADRMGVI